MVFVDKHKNMDRIMFLSKFVLYFVVVDLVAGTTISTNVTSITTSAPPITVPSTMTPAEKINFTLEMKNSGPVVLDSQIEFVARLLDKKGKVAQSKEFLYQWNNNADHSFTSVKGDLEYTYVREFHSASTQHGQWVMNLAVYTDQDYDHMINFGSMKFVLTDTLNGFLELKQDLEYQRNKNIFSTDSKIDLFTNHTDKFVESRRQAKPTYQFFWFKDEDLLRSSEEPHLNISIGAEGNYTIQCEIYAFFQSGIGSLVQPRRRFPPVDAEKLKQMRSIDFPEIQERRNPGDKFGKFTTKITLKSPLTSVDVSGDRSAAIGEYVELTITSKGSRPTTLCWNMTAMNSSQPSLNASCPPDEFIDSNTHTVQIKLTELGWKTVWFTVYNDVSYMSYPVNVYAYDPDSVNVPALTIPLVFCTLGLIVIIVGGVYLNKLRKKPVIEVADFDFHPSVASENGVNVFSRLANNIKLIWNRNNVTRTRSTPNLEQTTAKQFGNSSLYESL